MSPACIYTVILSLLKHSIHITVFKYRLLCQCLSIQVYQLVFDIELMTLDSFSFQNGAYQAICLMALMGYLA